MGEIISRKAEPGAKKYFNNITRANYGVFLITSMPGYAKSSSRLLLSANKMVQSANHRVIIS
jgi:hypothetical protein